MNSIKACFKFLSLAAVVIVIMCFEEENIFRLYAKGKNDTYICVATAIERLWVITPRKCSQYIPKDSIGLYIKDVWNQTKKVLKWKNVTDSVSVLFVDEQMKDNMEISMADMEIYSRDGVLLQHYSEPCFLMTFLKEQKKRIGNKIIGEHFVAASIPLIRGLDLNCTENRKICGFLMEDVDFGEAIGGPLMCKRKLYGILNEFHSYGNKKRFVLTPVNRSMIGISKNARIITSLSLHQKSELYFVFVTLILGVFDYIFC